MDYLDKKKGTKEIVILAISVGFAVVLGNAFTIALTNTFDAIFHEHFSLRGSWTFLIVTLVIFIIVILLLRQFM